MKYFIDYLSVLGNALSSFFKWFFIALGFGVLLAFACSNVKAFELTNKEIEDHTIHATLINYEQDIVISILNGNFNCKKNQYRSVLVGNDMIFVGCAVIEKEQVIIMWENGKKAIYPIPKEQQVNPSPNSSPTVPGKDTI